MSKSVTDAIKMIPTISISVDLIDFDTENPNYMTDEQMDGLEIFMKKIDFAVDVWLNKKKNGRYLCIDGEHRVKILIRNKIKMVNAKVFNFKKREDIILARHIANKLRGEHDSKMDQNDFEFLQEKGKLTDLAMILAQPIENFLSPTTNEIKLDNSIMDSREETFLHGSIKQIYLFFDNETYEDIIPRLKKLMLDFDVDNHTDLVIKLVELAEKNKS